MDTATDSRYRDTSERLALLLIAQPREGWEEEFQELIRREVARLALPTGEQERENSTHITYTQRHDAETVKESNVLSIVYKLCLERSRARKEAVPENRPDDARKDQDAGTKHHCT